MNLGDQGYFCLEEDVQRVRACVCARVLRMRETVYTEENENGKE